MVKRYLQTIEAPPLSRAAQRIIELPAKEREDLRVLSLIAKTDPVFLGNLLSAANAAVYGDMPAVTDALEAVKRLGAAASYDRLLAVCVAGVFPTPPSAMRHRNALIGRSVRISASLRRACRVKDQDEGLAGLLGILESMGLYALLGNREGADLAHLFESALGAGSALGPSANGYLCGYHLLSRKICAAWGAPAAILNALHPFQATSLTFLLETVLIKEDVRDGYRVTP